MIKYLPIAYKSKSNPRSATMYLYINTYTWKIGFAHYEELETMTINTEIQFLCFTLRWRKFIEDIWIQNGYLKWVLNNKEEHKGEKQK